MNSSDQIEAERRHHCDCLCDTCVDDGPEIKVSKQQDGQFANSKDHHIAMTVRAMMSAITDLCEMADHGIELVKHDIGDLELSHARLGHLLDYLQARKAA